MMLLIPHRRRRAAAFTLVELLVVIGIVALLMGLLLVGVTRARVRGKAAKTASDLQAIAVALDAYKLDYGDYPRPIAPPWTVANAGGTSAFPLLGAQTLCKALLSPGPANEPGALAGPYHRGLFYGSGSTTAADYMCIQDTSSAPPGTGWVALSVEPADGYGDPNYPAQPGPGFRIRQGGPPHQPYLNAETFPITSDTQGFELMDGYGHAIEYCPAAINRNSIIPTTATPTGSPAPESRWATAYVDAILPTPPQGTASTANQAVGPLYDVAPIIESFMGGMVTEPNALTNIRACMGDRFDTVGTLAPNGVVDPGDTAVTLPYLLWSAGNDGIYGPDGTGRSDDVTNFDLPPGIRK